LADVEQSVASRFRAQVQRNPDALAITEASRSLCYNELDALANQVAHAILAAAPGAARPVALLLAEGIPQIVGLLGVLKAGCFYVPLDPTLPTVWISSILENTTPALLIACKSTEEQAQAGADGNTLILNLDSRMDSTHGFRRAFCLTIQPYENWRCKQ